MSQLASNGLISLFVRHPVAGNLLMVMMLMFGAYGLTKINRQLLPDFDLNTIAITVQWPGASPEDVEANVIAAIESEVRFLEGVRRVNSTARDSLAEVGIQYSERTNMSKALSDVQAAVARITSFPADIEQPVINQFIAPFRVCRIKISGPYAEQTLKSFANHIRNDLLDRGMSQIEIRGARDSEIWVEVSDSILRRLDLTLDDIASKINQSSLNLPSGSIETSGVAQQIRTEALARSAAEIQEIEVVSTAAGNKLRLKDIARIHETFEKNAVSHVRNGRSAISLYVVRARGADSIAAQRIVTQYVAEVRAELPPNMSVDMFDVLADQTTQRVQMLVNNGIGGLILVLLMLMFFLNRQVAFWVAMGIPTSIMAAIGAMALMGISLNLISMFALIMGLGIVVDDAIVVGEHTQRLHQDGMSPEKASITAAKKMITPVMAASLTTIATFLPMLMVSREVGQIIWDLPLTIIFVIFASLVECYLVLPMHLRKSLQDADRIERNRKPSRFQLAFSHFRDTRFHDAIAYCFDRRYAAVLITICTFLISLSLVISGRVSFDFFLPPEDNTVHANIAMTPGTPREKTLEMVDELARSANVAANKLTSGNGGLRFFEFGMIGGMQDPGNRTGDHVGAYTVELIPGDDRDIRTQHFVSAWRKEIRAIPGLESFVVFENSDAGPPGKDIDIRLHGAELDVLKKAAAGMRHDLAKIPGINAVEDNLPYGKREILIAVTPEGRAMGFTAESVARQVRNAFEGVVAKRFSQDQEEIIVRVKLEAPDNAKPQTIRDFYLRAPDGTEVPLTEVAHLDSAIGFSQIQREDGLRQVSLTAGVDRGVTTPNVVLEVISENVAPKIEQQYGVRISFKGKAEEQSDAVNDSIVALLVAVITMYVILASVFSSYMTPLVVMSIIPFGFIGAVVGHWVLGISLSMLSLMALLGLAGVMVNDSIILVLAVNRLRADGKVLRQAIILAAQDRLRPVLLTTLTTIGGLTPLLFERSFQAQLLQPLAVTLIFGLLFSPLLVLIFVPSLLGIGADLRSRPVRGAPVDSVSAEFSN